jgi:hypothetical protein
MMNLDEKVVGVWAVETISGYQDWMAMIREIEPDVKYELKYRFRYHKDDKVFDSEDTVSGYQGELSGTRSYVIALFRCIAKSMEAKADGDLYELMNEGDYKAFVRKFMELPFVYVRAKEKV